MTESSGGGIVRITIGRIRGHRTQAGERERAKERLLLLRPAGSADPWRMTGRGEQRDCEHGWQQGHERGAGDTGHEEISNRTGSVDHRLDHSLTLNTSESLPAAALTRNFTTH